MKLFSALFLFLLVGCGGYLSMSQKRLFSDVISWWDDEPKVHRQIYRDPENCFLVLGTVETVPDSIPLQVVAVEMSGESSEIMAKRSVRTDEDFLLYLPGGDYQFALFADLDNDGFFSQYECIALDRKNLSMARDNYHLTFDVEELASKVISFSYNEAVQNRCASLVGKMRNGAIESLDSPLFSEAMGKLGLFDPYTFLEQTGTLFFTTSPRDMKKTPVLFVHGISGTPADFSTLVQSVDTTRYEPWFFYYPTGISLETTSELLYDLFLSGEYIDLKHSNLIVVAHSMGGLVARSAINRYLMRDRGKFLTSFLTFSTPYDGNASAAVGVKYAPYTVPSWIDVAEGSDFIQELEKIPLNGRIDFRLFFSYGDNGPRSGDNSDGVISLKSQLKEQFQSEATRIEGFNETHTSILTSATVVERFREALAEM